MNSAFIGWWKKAVGFEGLLSQWHAIPADRKHDRGGAANA